MATYDSGTILWVHEANDPHNTGKERPVIVIRHSGRPYLIQREGLALSVRRERSDHSRNRTLNRAGVNRVRSVPQSTVQWLFLSLQRLKSGVQQLCVGF